MIIPTDLMEGKENASSLTSLGLKDFVFLNYTAEKKDNYGAGESSGCFDGTVLECWCSCKSIIQQCQLLIDIVIYEY